MTIAPVDEVARRVTVAETMAPRYAANDGVAAVLLAGSVARGLADARSDVEVDVYWHRPPSDAERRAIVDDAGWEWVYAEVDEHEWADGVRLDGVKVDVSQFVTAHHRRLPRRAARGRHRAGAPGAGDRAAGRPGPGGGRR